MPSPKTNSKSLNTEYSIIITQYMTSDKHLTDTTHCRKGCLLHNSTPHERTIGTQNMTAKGIRNTTDNILVHIQTLLKHLKVFKFKKNFRLDLTKRLKTSRLKTESLFLIRKTCIWLRCVTYVYKFYFLVRQTSELNKDFYLIRNVLLHYI